MKKKLLLGAMGLATALGLSACDFAEGVDHDFGLKAEEVFHEIDEDTAEGELSDAQDVRNLELVSMSARSDREQAAAKALEDMLKFQDKASLGEREALQGYLDAREEAIGTIGLEGYHSVLDFTFTEED